MFCFDYCFYFCLFVVVFDGCDFVVGCFFEWLVECDFLCVVVCVVEVDDCEFGSCG